MLPDVDPFVFPLSHTFRVPTATASSLTSQTIPFSLDVHVQDNNKSSPNIMIWLSLKGNNRMVLMLHSALKMESASHIYFHWCYLWYHQWWSLFHPSRQTWTVYWNVLLNYFCSNPRWGAIIFTAPLAHPPPDQTTSPPTHAIYEAWF